MENSIKPRRLRDHEFQRLIPVLIFVLDPLMSIENDKDSLNPLASIDQNGSYQRIIYLNTEFLLQHRDRVPIFLHIIENYGLSALYAHRETVIWFHFNNDRLTFSFSH